MTPLTLAEINRLTADRNAVEAAIRLAGPEDADRLVDVLARAYAALAAALKAVV